MNKMGLYEDNYEDCDNENEINARVYIEEVSNNDNNIYYVIYENLRKKKKKKKVNDDSPNENKNQEKHDSGNKDKKEKDKKAFDYTINIEIIFCNKIFPFSTKLEVNQILIDKNQSKAIDELPKESYTEKCPIKYIDQNKIIVTCRTKFKKQKVDEDILTYLSYGDTNIYLKLKSVRKYKYEKIRLISDVIKKLCSDEHLLSQFFEVIESYSEKIIKKIDLYLQPYKTKYNNTDHSKNDNNSKNSNNNNNNDNNNNNNNINNNSKNNNTNFDINQLLNEIHTLFKQKKLEEKNILFFKSFYRSLEENNKKIGEKIFISCFDALHDLIKEIYDEVRRNGISSGVRIIEYFYEHFIEFLRCYQTKNDLSKINNIKKDGIIENPLISFNINEMRTKNNLLRKNDREKGDIIENRNSQISLNRNEIQIKSKKRNLEYSNEDESNCFFKKFKEYNSNQTTYINPKKENDFYTKLVEYEDYVYNKIFTFN